MTRSTDRRAPARRGSRFVAALVGLAATALAACSPSQCEQRRMWHNQAATACQSCVASSCEREGTAVSNAANACQAEFACVARCPDQSALTCGCVDACLVTARCQQVNDDLTACAVAHCESACR